MDRGAAQDPFMRRPSNKRDFSTMAAASTHFAEPSLRRDEHYENEHAARRRRIQSEPSVHARVHLPGDGLDFRRPVMSSSTSTAARAVEGGGGNGGGRAQNATVIDLTDDVTDEDDDSDARTPMPPAYERYGVSRRAQRLPRFGREVMHTGEEERDTSNLAGSSSLALPGHPSNRPQFRGLRRPARPSAPFGYMDEDSDDEVEIIEERSSSRPRSPHGGPVHAAPLPRRLHREATPYPVVGETIDLTEDNHDDDVTHINTRQRLGVNLERPGATAGVGTRNIADRPIPGGRIETVANLFREGGGNIGGRLMQRLQHVMGLEGELMREEEAMAQYNRTHVTAQPRRHDHHHQTHRRRPHGRVNGGQGVRILQEMPGMMDVRMTAFDITTGGPNRPQSPKYEAPPKAEKGFTHSPGEDEVVVCPNCGDELAMGGDDIKQQIWVVKGCGHAYCGDCVQHRGRSTTKKGKGKAPASEDPNLPPTFKKCVVEGCGKSTVGKAMIHVYLGS